MLHALLKSYIRVGKACLHDNISAFEAIRIPDLLHKAPDPFLLWKRSVYMHVSDIHKVIPTTICT